MISEFCHNTINVLMENWFGNFYVCICDWQKKMWLVLANFAEIIFARGSSEFLLINSQTKHFLLIFVLHNTWIGKEFYSGRKSREVKVRKESPSNFVTRAHLVNNVSDLII